MYLGTDIELPGKYQLIFLFPSSIYLVFIEYKNKLFYIELY